MDSHLVPDNGHFSLDRDPLSKPPSLPRSPGERAIRLHRAASLIVILLSSLGLWGTIWAVVALLVPERLP